ncbi:MAG: succinate dehydrogenase [Rariglobus sp.]|jgi:succinate dehydrogenase / fumarate reductase cytochrome b subunit|nr:succinate dehydrogenase [Rariglobus sp.]
MSLIGNLFFSSIGRKFIMAITGLVLVGFVFGHLVGNLQIFLPPDHINGYAHFLQDLGPALWLVRIVLLVCVALHIWAAVALTLESKAARGPNQYGVHKWLHATWASRAMRWTGVIVFFFILYHLAHFTLGVAGQETFKTQLPEWTMQHDAKELGITLAKKGEVVHDVYSMVFLGFQNPVVSLFYIIATTLLSIHLLHGVESLFQTIGWRNGSWSAFLRKVVTGLCILYFLGNLVIPGAILAGIAKPAEGTAAAKITAGTPVTAPAAHN